MSQPDARLLSEAGAATEFMRLMIDPVYFGVGVPRGDGRHVLVLPGLFGNDFYLQPLRTWLTRIGYRPVRSTLAVNAGCSERLSRQIEGELERRAGLQAPVSIIGHSRGGILGWAIAARLGSRVSSLILLGSPAPALATAMKHGYSTGQIAAGVPATLTDSALRARQILDPDCDFPSCACPFTTALAMPLSAATKVTAIVSPDDPIVPAAIARAPGATNIEVRGTHSGLAANAAAYRAMGAALAGR